MIELNEQDRAAIDKISRRRGKYPASVGGLREECFIAGLAAGIERAAKVCEEVSARPVIADPDYDFGCRECQIAIRALLK